MSKGWKRGVVILVVVAATTALVLVMVMIETRSSVQRFDNAKAASNRTDTVTIARDSIQRAETDRRMKQYMKEHPPAVRDKY
jgi:uncharacterized protein YpmS